MAGAKSKRSSSLRKAEQRTNLQGSSKHGGYCFAAYGGSQWPCCKRFVKRLQQPWQETRVLTKPWFLDRAAEGRSQCPSGHFVLFYLEQDVEADRHLDKGLNALPGILFFSTSQSLSGASLSPRARPSQCPSGHFVLFYGSKNTFRSPLSPRSQCPSGHFVLFYGSGLCGRCQETCVSMPFRAFCSFLQCPGRNSPPLSDRSSVSMPFRAFCSFLLQDGEVGIVSVQLSQCPSGHFVLFYSQHVGMRLVQAKKVSMPFRAFCSFLPTSRRRMTSSPSKVSMPFRAFCSFLPFG